MLEVRDYFHLAELSSDYGYVFTVVPISDHQDTVGPIVRSVADAAAVLSVIAGKDPNDTFTLAQPSPVHDFTKALNPNALKGKRIGVPRKVFLNDSISGNDPFVNVAFEAALDTIRGLGATVVDPADLPSAEEIAVSNNETFVLDVDFKVSFFSPNLNSLAEYDFPDPIECILCRAVEESLWSAYTSRIDCLRQCKPSARRTLAISGSIAVYILASSFF